MRVTSSEWLSGFENPLLQSSFSASLVPHPTPTPVPQIRLANRRHCALYKFIYLLTYLPVHGPELPGRRCHAKIMLGHS